MQQFAQMGFPEMYERALVGPLFQPWAEHLVRACGIGPSAHVLDIACGTGIVARLAKAHVGTGRVVGVDVNPGMLAVARSLSPDVEWQLADATALPVEDDEFDVVLCQQGLQFFPDRVAAVTEMRRVLTAGGRLAVSTWRSDEEMPVLRELRRVAEQRMGSIDDRRHSLPEAHELEQLLLRAGFHDVRVESLTQTIRFPDGAAFVFLNAMALVGMSTTGKDLSDDARAHAVSSIVADSRDVIDAHTGADGFAYQIGANVATASG